MTRQRRVQEADGDGATRRWSRLLSSHVAHRVLRTGSRFFVKGAETWESIEPVVGLVQNLAPDSFWDSPTPDCDSDGKVENDPFGRDRPKGVREFRSREKLDELDESTAGPVDDPLK